MPALNEGRHTGEHILSEANGTRSREQVTVTKGAAALPPGQVMGRITATGAYAPYSNSANNGTEVAAGILYAGLPEGAGNVDAVLHVRDCEVAGVMLTGLDTPGRADLTALGIIVR